MSVTIRDEDAACLLDILSEHATICIEGHTCSGKTTAGKKIAETFGAKFFDTDDYIIKNQNPTIERYEDLIDINKLSKEINEEEGKKVIVGICLRNILRLDELDEESIFIYIKCISRTTFQWIEENTLDDLREGNIDIDNIPEPHASDYRYILEKSPQNKADIIFERWEENI
ncbi:shikimate kinase [Escherichia coli]